MRLPNNPTIYELHTAAYLQELTANSETPVFLDTIPDSELNRLMALGIDAVWLMGVWRRSPAAVAIDAANSQLQAEFRDVLPDFTPQDAIGSAYSVQDYTVDARFGGNDALARLRDRLAQRGIGLILDFVPNHTATDHSWVREHVDYYIHTSAEAARQDPVAFMEFGENGIAKGRDPNSAPWPDVLQMNAFSPGYREATANTLRHIATMSDGVRCDMAMLMLDDVVQRTWGHLAGEPLASAYWQGTIGAIREDYPDFAFIAECYWDTERTLIEQGFDYCYDKTLYDFLVANNPAGAQDYLEQTADIQPHMLHFIENHDEPRAAARLPLAQSMAAGAIMNCLPGARLVHHGQIEGKQVKIPVQLARGPYEPPNSATVSFYTKTLAALAEANVRDGLWAPVPAEKASTIAYICETGTAPVLLVVNYLDVSARFVLPDHGGRSLAWSDILSDEPNSATAHTELSLAPWQVLLLVPMSQ